MRRSYTRTSDRLRHLRDSRRSLPSKALSRLRQIPGQPESQAHRSSRSVAAVLAAVVAVVVVIGIVVAVSAGSKRATQASSGAATHQSQTTIDALPALASQWTGYTTSFISAAGQENAAVIAAAGGMQKQAQRVTTDTTTASSDLAGSNCAALITSTDYSAYSTCISQDDQAATQAENDENAANATSQQDLDTIDSQVSSLNGLVHTYVSQMRAMSWTPALQGEAGSLAAGLSKWGNDWQQIGDITGTNASEIGPLLTSTLAQDKASWEDAMVALASSLGVTNPTITGIH